MATAAPAQGVLVSEAPTEGARAPLQWFNIANPVAYALNLAITYVSLTGVFGETNSDLSAKYQTLVTPAGFTFSIWGVIFIWEAVFAVAQLLPMFRAAEVVRLVTPWWIATCIAQVFWTVAFAQEVIWLALIFMLLILASLLGLAAVTDGLTMKVADYWLLRAPFSVHLGWIIAAAVVNVNVMADAASGAPATLLALAVAGLAAVAAVVTAAAFAVRSPDFIVCLVATWAFLGIRSELNDAGNLDDETRFNPYIWDRVTLSGLGGAAVTIAIYALIVAVLAAVKRAAPPCLARKDGAYAPLMPPPPPAAVGA